ncbi:MAG: T9SS type A sorting domain-containing protein [Bacteroidota bacterium]
MKKIFYILLCLSGILSAQLAYAQPCVPDPNLTYNGISPDGLPPAMAGYYYWTTLSFKIPRDSTVRNGGIDIPVTVDSARFLYAAGKPDSFAFTCDKPGCVWPGGTKGCALFDGQVSKFHNDTTLEYPMKIYTITWYRLTGSPDQFSRIDSATNYVFRILKFNGTSELTTYTNLKAYPNPTQGIVTIELRDIQDEVNEVTIMDAFGKLVYSRHFDKPSAFLTTYTADLSNYKPGLYVVTLTSGNKIGTSKVMLH